MNNKKIEYLLNCIVNYGKEKICPYCGSKDIDVIDRKFIFARLLECNNCHLYFRHPIDSTEENKHFYQSTYIETGLVSNVPPPEVLEVYKKNLFKDSGKDYSEKIESIKLFKPTTAKLIDYGSSWGYISYQFKKNGFDLQSFEISVPSAQIGRKLLELDIKTEVSELLPGNDVFFSAHVIEHLPDLNVFFATARRLLKQDGLMFTYCPNGSKDFRKKHPVNFHSIWGLVHPSYLNAEFYQYVFKNNPYYITSSPYDLAKLAAWNQKDQVIDRLDGDELLVISAINVTL